MGSNQKRADVHTVFTYFKKIYIKYFKLTSAKEIKHFIKIDKGPKIRCEHYSENPPSIPLD